MDNAEAKDLFGVKNGYPSVCCPIEDTVGPGPGTDTVTGTCKEHQQVAPFIQHAIMMAPTMLLPRLCASDQGVQGALPRTSREQRGKAWQILGLAATQAGTWLKLFTNGSCVAQQLEGPAWPAVVCRSLWKIEPLRSSSALLKAPRCLAQTFCTM
jgi:hypothetical protein